MEREAFSSSPKNENMRQQQRESMERLKSASTNIHTISISSSIPQQAGEGSRKEAVAESDQRRSVEAGQE